MPLASSLALGLLVACGGDATPDPQPAPAPAPPAAEQPPPSVSPTLAAARAAFGELPKEAAHSSEPVTEAKIALGRALYYDTRLSASGEISCNSCHLLDEYGVDGAPTSTGHEGQVGGRNAPTVYNAALHISQFWDGREPDVEAQAKGPILNPIEMAMPDAETVVKTLQGIPGYAPLFAAAFPGEADPITYDNLGRAIGAFERRLITPGPFDRYLAGEDGALTAEQEAGLDLFMKTGCTTCHSGAAVGGQVYMKLGLVNAYGDDDMGRFDVTGAEADKQVFKAPSLRNIAQTGPWFHDGSVATLDEAIQKMGWHQLGVELDEGQVASIEGFLGALTGPLPTDYIKPPQLPE